MGAAGLVVDNDVGFDLKDCRSVFVILDLAAFEFLTGAYAPGNHLFEGFTQLFKLGLVIEGFVVGILNKEGIKRHAIGQCQDFGIDNIRPAQRH